MSVIKALFNPEIDQRSPIIEDLQREVDYDETGQEFIRFVPVDYSKLIKSNGSVQDWSLNALLKAGIDPNFPIHTGLNTRLEGVNTISGAIEYLNQIVAEDEKQTDTK